MSEVPMTAVEQLPTAVVVHVLTPNLVRKIDLDAICSDVDAAQSAVPSLPFILDLAQVGFMGSLAMGTLIGLNKEFKARGQRLIFVNLQQSVSESINVIQMHRIAEFMPDVLTALRSLGPAL